MIQRIYVIIDCVAHRVLQPIYVNNHDEFKRFVNDIPSESPIRVHSDDYCYAFLGCFDPADYKDNPIAVVDNYFTEPLSNLFDKEFDEE